jgi:hypothetical protein
VNPRLTHKLDIALEGTEVAFFNVSEDATEVEMFVEVLSLPESGPMDEDPRRIVVFKNASSFRSLVRQKADPERRDWKEMVALPLQDIKQLNELIASLQIKEEMTDWRHFDAPERTERWPSEISFDATLAGQGRGALLWWGFEGWREGGWPSASMFLEGVIRFDEVEVFRAGREPLAVEQFADEGTQVVARHVQA